MNTSIRRSETRGFSDILPPLPVGSWDTLLFIGSFLLSIWLFTVWLVQHWEFLPDWAPVPGPELMMVFQCFQPITLCVLGCPTLLALLVHMIAVLTLLSHRILVKHIRGLVVLVIAVVVLGLAVLPWIFGGRIDDVLLRYSIARYDAVIGAIEQYHQDFGHYPPNLDVLVPHYLPEKPGIYLKYGERLKYDPSPSTGRFRYGPFTFELFGHIPATHGRTLKYCPVEDGTCSGRSELGEGVRERIDSNWIWIYTSGL